MATRSATVTVAVDRTRPARAIATASSSAGSGRRLSSTVSVARLVVTSHRQASRSTWTGGTDSSQTVRQMPVVRWYQIACGSGSQSCLPRGMRPSSGSSNARTTTAWSSLRGVEGGGDVEREGSLATLVGSDHGPIHPDHGLVVDGAEVQEQPATRGVAGRRQVGRGDGNVIPDTGVVLGQPDAGRLGLGWKRQLDLAVEPRSVLLPPAVKSLHTVVEGEGDAPVERHELWPHEHGARVGAIALGRRPVHGGLACFVPHRWVSSRSSLRSVLAGCQLRSASSMSCPRCRSWLTIWAWYSSSRR